ncbi:MAG: PAS domain-containing protein [Anaerolineae bacterium]|nr:PAS domain-containing protein [Anaerolineae bacterium]
MKVATITSLQYDDPMMRMLVDNLPACAVALFDSNLRIVRAGGELLERWGFHHDEVEGRLLREMFPPSKAAWLSGLVSKVMAGETIRAEYPQEQMHLHVVAKPTNDGGVILMRDIRDVADAHAQRFTQELRSTEARKDGEINLLKNQMAERILHEFRNPLASVASSAELLHLYFETMPEDRRREHIDRIAHEVHRLSSVLDDILAIMK